MTRRYEATQLHNYGEVTNDDAMLELVAASTVGSGHYLYIEKLYCSIYEPAIGSGGIFRIRDTTGALIHTTNADGVKDLPFDFGEYGMRLKTDNVGLQVVVSGGQTKQASVSVMFKGHVDNR